MQSSANLMQERLLSGGRGKASTAEYTKTSKTYGTEKNENISSQKTATRLVAVTDDVRAVGDRLLGGRSSAKGVGLLQKENALIREDIRILRSKKEEVLREIEECKDVIFLKNEKIREMREEIEAVDMEIREIEAKNAKTKQLMRQEEHDSRIRQQQEQHQLENLERRLEFLEEEDHETKELNSRLRWELSEAKQQLAQLESGNIALQSRKSELQESINSISSEISSTESQRRALESTAESQKEQLASNTELLAKVADDYTLVIQKLRQLEAREKALREENHRLQSLKSQS